MHTVLGKLLKNHWPTFEAQQTRVNHIRLTMSKTSGFRFVPTGQLKHKIQTQIFPYKVDDSSKTEVIDGDGAWDLDNLKPLTHLVPNLTT